MKELDTQPLITVEKPIKTETDDDVVLRSDDKCSEKSLDTILGNAKGKRSHCASSILSTHEAQKFAPMNPSIERRLVCQEQTITSQNNTLACDSLM